jgi:hypothetical protein
MEGFLCFRVVFVFYGVFENKLKCLWVILRFFLEF